MSVDILIFAALIFALLQIIVLTISGTRGKKANYFLAALLCVVVISTWNVLTFAGKVPNFQLVDYWLDGSIYLWGPLLYLFVGSFSQQTPISARTIIIHTLLGASLFLLQWPILMMVRADIFSQTDASAIRIFFLLGFYLHFAIYFYFTINLLPKRDQNALQDLTKTERIDLNWLQRLIWLFGAILALDFCLIIFSLITGWSALSIIPYYLSLSALIISGIGFLTLIRNEEYWIQLTNTNHQKYHSSAIDFELGTQLFETLNQLMIRDAPYLDNELKLADLAKLLGVNTHQLSQIINAHGKTNFYDYINAYRTKHAARLLMDTPGGNITRIAFDSGFNNRVSFGKSFKKHFGTTPSAYRENIESAANVK